LFERFIFSALLLEVNTTQILTWYVANDISAAAAVDDRQHDV
jgi:hypothetical protein